MGVTIKLKKNRSRSEDKAKGKADADYAYQKKVSDDDRTALKKMGMGKHPNTDPVKPKGSVTKRSQRYKKRRTKAYDKNESIALQNIASSGGTISDYRKNVSGKKRRIIKKSNRN